MRNFVKMKSACEAVNYCIQQILDHQVEPSALLKKMIADGVSEEIAEAMVGQAVEFAALPKYEPDSPADVVSTGPEFWDHTWNQ